MQVWRQVALTSWCWTIYEILRWLRIPLWLDCGFDRENLRKLLVEAEYDLKNYADRG